jgi:endonuclease YncB( thermonuclease family)
LDLDRRTDQGSGLWLVERGWAAPYRDRKCEIHRDAAARAEAGKVGMWDGSFIMPWEWREQYG